MQSSGGGSLLNGLYRTISHCISQTPAEMASGSDALFSVLDADESEAAADNGGTPMRTEDGDHKTDDDFYGACLCFVSLKQFFLYSSSC